MKWLSKSAHVFPVIALLALGACTRDSGPKSPEAALERYVKTAFSARSAEDHKALSDMSDGDAKEWLDAMSVEVFEKQFIKNNMQLVSLKTSEKREEAADRVSLVYELVFKDGKVESPITDPDKAPKNATSPATYTNKKIAYLKQMGDGTWKITATKNVKTYIERKEALEVPPLSMLPPDPEEKQEAPKGK